MAKTLSNSGITTNNTIEAGHVTQSVDALTGTDAYDITISGSLSLPGTIASGSFQGDGSGLTGITAEWDGTHVGNAEITGSLIVTSYIDTPEYKVNGTSSLGLDGSQLNLGIDGSWDKIGIGREGVNKQIKIFGPLTASGDISASGDLFINTIYLNGDISYNALASNSNELQIGAGTPWTSYTFGRPGQIEPMLFNANITASGNISASGDVYGVTGSFSHLVGNSPITVSSPIISQLNNTKVVEVENSSSFPTSVGTQITLEENTTYVVRGNVNMSDTLFASGSGISLIGLDRNLDTLTYTSSSTFLTVENSDFTIRDLKFSATNTGSLLISGSNYTSGSFNQGRSKIFEVVNSQFRNCGNVADFKGYDLIDFSNTLFFYVQAPTIGVKFTDTSKTEISSCEFIRWYDETSNPSPSGYSTAPMIEFADTGSEGAGFGAVNVNGCIIHPQVQQDGVRIATGSITGFGTISSNAFINLNLTTGSVFSPTNIQGLPDYSLTSTVGYDVFANQGILNSTAGTVTTVKNNTQITALTLNTPAIVDINVSAAQQAGVRFEVDSLTGRSTYTGTKQIYTSIHCSFSFLKGGGMTVDYVFYIALNGTPIAASALALPDLDDAVGAATLVYGTLLNQNDYIELWVENILDDDDISVYDITMLIRE